MPNLIHYALTGSLLFASPIFASAQTAAPANSSRTVRVSIPFIRSQKRGHLVISRGDKLHFFGDFGASDGVWQITLKAGGNTVASRSFQKEWALDWDSATNKTPGRLHWIYAAHPGGQEVALTSVDVDILDSVPFTLETAPVEKTKGRYTLRVHATSGLKAERFELTSDEQPMKAKLPANGEGTVDTGELLPGTHRLGVKAVLPDGSLLFVGDTEITVPARVRIAPDSRSGIYEIKDGMTNIGFAISTDMEIVPIRTEYFFDGEGGVFAASNGLANFDGSRALSGKHRIRAVVTVADGATYTSEDVIIEIRRDLKADYLLWKESFMGYATRQAESLQLARQKLDDRYLGKKQCENARKDLLTEIEHFAATPAALAALDYPTGLEGEDSRSLELARKQLIESYQKSASAMCRLANKLDDLTPYDGTITNAPQDFQIKWDNDCASIGTDLKAAEISLSRALDNLKLVEHRGNMK